MSLSNSNSSSNENLSFYSLFGQSETSNQIILPISSILKDSTNVIQHPVKTNSNKKLFVGNLPKNTSLEDLKNVFEKYGKINMNLSIVKEESYAFIHFFNELDAQMACKELNNTLFKDRYIRVQFSTSLGHMNKQNNSLPTKKFQSQSCYSFNKVNSNLNNNPIQSNSSAPIGRPIRGINYNSFKSEQSLQNLPSINQFWFIERYLEEQQQQNIGYASNNQQFFKLF